MALAFTDLAVVAAVKEGVTVTTQVVADDMMGVSGAYLTTKGLQIRNSVGRTALLCVNASADHAISVKILSHRSIEDLAVPDRVVVIPAAGMKIIGPFSSLAMVANTENDASPGVSHPDYVQFLFTTADSTYDDEGADTLSVAAITIPQT